jgi:hypothetical protein
MTKCPYTDCGYEFGYVHTEDGYKQIGDEPFFVDNKSTMVQTISFESDDYGKHNYKDILGCPKCNRMFMGNE